MFNGKVSDIPTKDSIVALTVSQPMTDALQTLFEKNILSAPVVDANGNFLGQVDLMDAVVFLVYFSKKTQELLRALGLVSEDVQVNFSGLFPEDEDLKDLFRVYENTGSLTNFSHVNPTKTIAPGAPLEDLSELLSVHHRVGVVDGDGRLVNYVTQSDFVKFLADRLQSTHSLLDINKTVTELELGSPSVVTINQNNIVIEALKLIVTKRVSSVVVLDAKGDFVNEVGPRDIRGINLETQFLDRLIMPISDYLEVLKKAPVKTLSGSATLKDVITVLCNQNMHRVHVVENDKPMRVISLGDLLRFLRPLNK